MKKIIILMMTFLLISTLLLTGCKKSKGSITVGAKNFTEQYIVGEMIVEILKNAGYDVKKQFGTGSTITRDGLLTGQTDIYADYTGTAWSVYLKHSEIINDPEELYNKIKKEDYEKNKVVWINRFKLNNTYALAVRQDNIVKYGTTISSLGKYISENPGELIVGIDHEFFERPDGFLALLKEYNFEVPKSDIKFMEVGLSYEALDKGNVDVAMVFSTDGLLKKYKLKVLEDNKQFFPVYNLCVTARDDLLKKFPEVEQLVHPLADLLDDVTMQNLNYQVDAEGLPADIVAKNFLKEKGLVN
ncbi:MAG: glycine/betaine ABC transporter substrate-binding protein [Spirochaetes bacterium]|nr:glycine/betaine ABC transporter substrate-binding protein [Spirochaetota bacterium]